MRKYDISCSVIIQNIAQLKPLYEDWETIIGNCDTLIFLGGHEYSTLEYISNILGVTTITVRNSSRSRGRSSGSSQSLNRTQRKLMNPDEIGKIKNTHCIIKIRSLDPFLTPKYDYPKHPNYKYTGDGDSKNAYINKLNNNKPQNSEDALLRSENIKQRTAARASQSISKKDKLFSDEMTFETFANSFNIKNAEDMFKRFSVVETYNINPAPEVMQVAEKVVTKQMVKGVAQNKISEALSEKGEAKAKPISVAISKKTNIPPSDIPTPTEKIASDLPEAATNNVMQWLMN